MLQIGELAFERELAFGVGSPEVVEEFPPKNSAENLHGEEELFSRGDPPLAVGREPIPCKKAADVDNNGNIEGVTDAVFLLRYLFLDEQAPDEPLRSCGIDQTPDELTCDSFPACP